MEFRINYRLLRSDIYRGARWNARRDTAQFQLMLTVENINPRSPGYKDYLWFFIPMYDARYTLPKEMQKKDAGNSKKKGTGRFMFNPGGAEFTDIPASSKRWIGIAKDLLPLIGEALNAAWSNGFLCGSHSLSDYSVRSAVMGWEVTGTLNVAMQIRNLGLAANRK